MGPNSLGWLNPVFFRGAPSGASAVCGVLLPDTAAHPEHSQPLLKSQAPIIGQIWPHVLQQSRWIALRLVLRSAESWICHLLEQMPFLMCAYEKQVVKSKM